MSKKLYRGTTLIEPHINQRVYKDAETKEIVRRQDSYVINKNGRTARATTLEEAREKLEELSKLPSLREINTQKRQEKEQREAEKYIGKQFGRLTVKEIYRDKYARGTTLYARCKCTCGNYTDVMLRYLLRGTTLSCGCYRQDRAENMLENHVVTGSRVTNYKMEARNSTGVKGVYPTPSGKYRATIWFKGKKIHLGTYSTLKEATEAREQAEGKYFKPEVEKYNKLMDEQGTPEFKIKDL